MYEGTYKLERSFTEFSAVWCCILTFDDLTLKVCARNPRRAVRRANRAMGKAVSLRNIVKSVKGICEELPPPCEGPCCNEDLREKRRNE